MESQVSKQLDYKKLQYVHPTYRMLKVMPLNGSQNVTITTAGGSETIFECPQKVYNKSRSYIQFNIAPSAAGAAMYGSWTDCIAPWRQAQFYNRGGIYVMDLNEVANYTKVVWKPEMSIKDFLTLDPITNSTTVAQSEYISKTNAAVAANDRPQDASNNKTSYTEAVYWRIGTNTTADPTYTVIIPLKFLNNTAMTVDKDLYYNETMLFRIVWNASNRIFWKKANSAVPTGTATANDANVSITNLSLFLAIEDNQEIANQVMAQAASATGLNVLIPYVYTYKTNLGPSSSQSVSLRFNRGHGRKLKKIYHSVFNNNETVNNALDNAGGNATTSPTAYDNDNRPYAATNGYAVARPKTQVFYTALDNKRQQEINLTCASFDDYMFLKDKLQGSAIQSLDEYYYNWFWLEDFTGIVEDQSASLNKDNLETGLDLAQERKWDFFGMQMNNYVADAGTAAASARVNNSNAGQYNHYSFGITEKMLTISPNGLTVL